MPLRDTIEMVRKFTKSKSIFPTGDAIRKVVYKKQRISPLLFTVYSATASSRSPTLPCFAAFLALECFSGLFAFTQFSFQAQPTSSETPENMLHIRKGSDVSRCLHTNQNFHQGTLNQAARQGMSARIRFARANIIFNFAVCFRRPQCIFFFR